MTSPETMIDQYVQACDAYYLGDQAIMSDLEFDTLESRLIEELGGREELNQAVIAAGGSVVGAAVTQIGDSERELEVPMLSLYKVHSEDDVKKWFEGMDIPASTRLSVHQKWDGIACLVVCDSMGNLINASTRGNGKVGKDITAGVKAFWTPALSWDGRTKSYRRIVRGEVLMSWDEMAKINEELAETDSDIAYNHPRPAASGVLRRATLSPDDPRAKFASRLTWRDHDAPGVATRMSQVAEKIHEIHDDASHGLPTDGVVVKVESETIRQNLGEDKKAPLWAVAYKFPDEIHHTKLLAVEWVQRRTKLAPTAVFETVVIDSTNVSRASLHNIDIIRGMDLWVGDTIAVRKANQIIPYVECVVTQGERLPEQRIEEPSDAELDFTEYVNHIIKTFEIKNVGPSAVKALVGSGLVDSGSVVAAIKSLYLLSSEDVEKIEGFGLSKAATITYGIVNGFQGREDYRWLAALGMVGVGKTVSEKILEKYSLSDIADSDDLSMLLDIDGIGQSTVEQITKNQALIGELVFVLTVLDITWKSTTGGQSVSAEHVGSPITGKSVVISGDFKYDRKTLAGMLKDRGAKVRTSVSRRTDVVLVGPGSGAKKDKAYELGIQIVGPEELDDLLDGKITVG